MRRRGPGPPARVPLQVPHRLLTLTLLPGLELCLLCGPRPPLSQLDPQVNAGRVQLPPLIHPLPPARPDSPARPSSALLWTLRGQPRPSRGPAPFGLRLNHHHHNPPRLSLLPHPSRPPPSSSLCPPRGDPVPLPWPRLLALGPPTSPPAPPLDDHAPCSFWSAGGSHCWIPCGPACLWDPADCPLASPCTSTSLGRARPEDWVGGPQALFPGHDTPFPQTAAPPPGAETLPVHCAALGG